MTEFPVYGVVQVNVKPFNVDVLQRSVLEANDVLPNPGSHRWLIYEKFRQDFVSLVQDVYCRDCQILPDQFPYREDAILAMLSGYWQAPPQHKIELRHRLGMKVPPIVEVDPDQSLSVLEFQQNLCDAFADTTITSHDFTIEEGASEVDQSSNTGQDSADLLFGDKDSDSEE